MARFGQILNTPVVLPRQILKSETRLIKVAGGATIQAGTQQIQPGMLLTWRQPIDGSFYFQPTKVGITVAGSTTTVINVANAAPFSPGDTLTFGAANGTVAANGVDYVNNVLTLTVALGGAPAAGVRVFSQTATQNKVDAIALNLVPLDTQQDQVTEVAIGGMFRQNNQGLEDWYHVNDIQNAGGVTTGLGAKLWPAFQCYSF